MKITLFSSLVLLLRTTLLFAQDFRDLAPNKMPNAAELAYFGGKHPDYQAYTTASDTASVRLVKAFLDDLMNGQFEVAQSRMVEGFIAYGPGFRDNLGANELLKQADQNVQLFTQQQMAIETAASVTIPKGEYQGQCVYVKAVWSALDTRAQGEPIRRPFHFLAQVDNRQLVRTYTSYGSDKLFYDLGFSLYSGQSVISQNR